MKKLFVILALSCVASCQLVAQTQKQKVHVSEVKATPSTKAENYAELTFDTLTHDFGKFSKLDPIVKCSFHFRNTGTAPLVIHQAFASCGCTIPSYTKEPIRPGEDGVIDVTYNGTDKFPGTFRKTITIRSNTREDEIIRLTIMGDME